VIESSKKLGVDARIIGRVEAAEKQALTIESKWGNVRY
jgi:hypothetical protein